MQLQFAQRSAPPGGEAVRPVPSSSHLCATGGLIFRCVDGRETLVAIRAYRAGEVIFTFDHATWRAGRDAFTVDDARGRPVYDPLLARVAHGREPNCRADFDLMALVARRRIAAGETLTVEGPPSGPRPEPLT